MTLDGPADALAWRKSSFSFANGNCVEVAQTPTGALAIRDTSDRAGAALAIDPAAWRSFMVRARADRAIS